MAWSLFDQNQVSPLQWADSVLAAGGWPQTTANRQSLIAWALLEGGGGTYNPLNTTEGAGTNFNSADVKNFPSWGAGVSATVATIKNGNYPAIVSDLKSGKGIGGNAGANLHTWSGAHGYSTLAATWAQAKAYLSGKSAPLPAGPVVTTSAQGGSSGIIKFLEGVAGGPINVQSGSDLGSIGAALAVGAAEIKRLADAIDWFFVPGHMLRMIAGVAGGALVLAGAVVLMKVGGGGTVSAGGSVAGVPVSADIPNAVALPGGILMVGLGSVGLFVAFHNLPADVTDLPTLLSYMQQRAHGATAAEATGVLPVSS